ncbi:MAG: hypothetical protein AAF197_03450 [Pseudomonadota bacterium]
MNTIEIESNYLRVKLLDHGARIVSILLTTEQQEVEVVQGYPDLAAYLQDESAMGASVGPIANRIANAQLSIEGERFFLPANEHPHCLHSGGVGFDRLDWRVTGASNSMVEFSLNFDARSMGLAHAFKAKATYRVTDSQLKVDYQINTDKLAYLNPTNHVYLNLGAQKSVIDDHEFEFYAQQLLLTDQSNIPTGAAVSLEEPTPYVLHQSTGPLANFAAGIDHHLVVSDEQNQTLKKLASVVCSQNDLKLDVFSTAPGFQFYTADHLSAPFVPQSAFCIEPQSIPNAINVDSQQVVLTDPYTPFRRQIIWQFST